MSAGSELDWWKKELNILRDKVREAEARVKEFEQQVREEDEHRADK
jgi:hypothetical protein